MGGGRQREFDKQDALDAAMHIFWEKGFIGASLTDLTTAMGINKPSLYATFGNKEELFIEATQHYMEHYVKPHINHLHDDKPLKIRLKNYLMSIVREQCGKQGAKGCYISICVSEAAGGHFPEKARQVATEVGSFAESFLTQFFIEEITHKNLPQQTDSALLARFIVTILHGTAAMARAGRSVKELEGIVDKAVATISL